MEGIPSGSVGGHGDERGNALLSVAHNIISFDSLWSTEMLGVDGCWLMVGVES